MSSATSGRIGIIGGGPAGSLLAILLAKRGFEPIVIERSAPFTTTGASGGRSINLALAARGIDALRRASVDGYVRDLMIPMRGRMIHDLVGQQRFLAYGQHTAEEIYSVSRAALNTLLYRLAAERHGVEYRFNTRCVDIDAATGDPIVEGAGEREALDFDVVFAADGAGSEVRRALAESHAISAREELLDHGYKELTIPAARDGEFVLEPRALHIWPRGGFMLIALPNPDHSFTATLFLPHAGESSFAAVGEDGVDELFRREFADAAPLMPALHRDYVSHPTGVLGTVACRPWSRGKVLLIGDAAHAVVPFHGQGMNAAFEDCSVLDKLLEQRAADGAGGWPDVFADFERLRAPNTRAIAEMAIENYQEMRDEVRDAKFELRAQLSFELERRFPGRFIPRYSMVMFHPEISYAEAQRRGVVQARILRELTAAADALAGVDFARAAKLVEGEL
jgi:kynurenine 3-monooxygenase